MSEFYNKQEIRGQKQVQAPEGTTTSTNTPIICTVIWSSDCWQDRSTLINLHCRNFFHRSQSTKNQDSCLKGLQTVYSRPNITSIVTTHVPWSTTRIFACRIPHRFSLAQIFLVLRFAAIHDGLTSRTNATAGLLQHKRCCC